MGVFVFQDSTVTMRVSDGVDILYNGKPVTEMVMIGDRKKGYDCLSVWFNKMELNC